MAWRRVRGLGTRRRDRCFSRFNDRHFQSSINGLKRLLESVHAGGVVNIENAVNLGHVPTKPPPKFSYGASDSRTEATVGKCLRHHAMDSHRLVE